MMRVLVLWADESSPNLGVRALGSGVSAMVQRIWPGAEIVFQNYGSRARELPFGRIRSLAKERVTGRLGMMRWLAGFDLAIDTRSGDSFADIYGLHRHATMSAVADLTTSAGVPLVLAPQTIGPFRTVRGRLLARRTLHRSAAVLSRDDLSTSAAAELGRPVDATVTDVVFAIPPALPTTRRDVLLNVSGLLWRANPHVDAERYRDTVARLHSELIAAGRNVSLLAHVLDSPDPDNDVPALREFADEHAPGSEIIVPGGLDDVRAAIAGSSLVIASRMHACLNALSQGVPTVPLAYSRKFAPLLERVGWRRTVDLRDPSDAVPAVMAHVGDADLTTDTRRARELADEQLDVASQILRAAL